MTAIRPTFQPNDFLNELLKNLADQAIDEVAPIVGESTTEGINDLSQCVQANAESCPEPLAQFSRDCVDTVQRAAISEIENCVQNTDSIKAQAHELIDSLC
ncbi:MAG: hypothetical protein K1060chlam2_00540 [Chlamydiae bacterium]|nr:hypothetical protein [Chlamydiota bacterium]